MPPQQAAARRHTARGQSGTRPAKVRGAKSLVEHCVEHCVNDGVGHARSLADDAPSEISRRMHDGAKRHPLPWNVPASSAGGIREPSPRSRFAIALSFGRFRTASSPPAEEKAARSAKPADAVPTEDLFAGCVSAVHLPLKLP